MTAVEIQERLQQQIKAQVLKVEDDSAKHKRHKQSQGKGGHYKLLIVSGEFEGMSLVQRHRKIYDVLQMHGSTQIHALAISAWTEKEWKEKNAASS